MSEHTLGILSSTLNCAFETLYPVPPYPVTLSLSITLSPPVDAGLSHRSSQSRRPLRSTRDGTNTSTRADGAMRLDPSLGGSRPVSRHHRREVALASEISSPQRTGESSTPLMAARAVDPSRRGPKATPLDGAMFASQWRRQPEFEAIRVILARADAKTASAILDGTPADFADAIDPIVRRSVMIKQCCCAPHRSLRSKPCSNR